MKTVAVEDAIGMVLAHDLTEIIPGKFKGCAFRKGQVIGTDDIPKLLDIGKKHIYVLDMDEHTMHENEAAIALARAAAGEGIRLTDPKEGKVELVSDFAGLLKVNTAALHEINSVEQVMFASLHTNHVYPAGRKIAGTRVIPLTIAAERVQQVVDICAAHAPVVSLRRLQPHRVGVVTTGSEVFHGRIQDKFGPVLRDKFSALGSTILRQDIVDDDADMIAAAIGRLLDDGVDFIACTGGMSVDPDDVTPTGIAAAGGKVVTYGAPVLPGAMFLLAYINGVPVTGLPGCVMYCRTSVFDLVVPRLLAGEQVTRSDIASLGHGGFCLSCDECRFPDCSFGKGL